MGGMVLTGLLASWGAVCLVYAGPLRAAWREPVFKRPVLVLESDDWGAGPLEQALGLERLSELLAACRDETGRPAMMTLGIVLQTADRDAMREAGGVAHVALGLDDARLAAVRDALHRGQALGVFAPQLHGLAHYWEPALVAAAADTPAVREWLRGQGPGWTEELPAALQSRWIDARSLPSRELPADRIVAAVAAEVAAWRRIFVDPPLVAVPTTFIWTQPVEEAYRNAGVSVLITPGARCAARDREGRPVCSGPPLFNGQRGSRGILYLVRDVYFEPAFGHPAERLAQEVGARGELGRPALVETHRFNYCGPRGSAAAFATLAEALRQVRARVARVRFASSLELARAIESRDPDWLETAFLRRCGTWARRALRLPGFARAARACGLAWPLRALGAWA
jgi:hypothetical protein